LLEAGHGVVRNLKMGSHEDCILPELTLVRLQP